MHRRSFLASLGAAALPLAGAAAKPNIVLFVADDLGYGGVSVQGCDIPTPNIDSIARNGARFTNGYVSCPVCSPTRAGLMTGRYQQRFGHEFNPGPANLASGSFGLSLNETPLPERLKKLGYSTGMFGKWHLGYADQYLPTRRGFDEFFGFPGGAHSYVSEDRRGGNPVMRGTTPVEEKEYLTDALAREAAAFLDRQRGKSGPYFLYMPFNAVHTPMEAVKKYIDRFRSIQDERRRTHAAMLVAMDDAIGRVLKAVQSARQEENTLISFISDNGGPTPQNTSSNKPLRGYKAQVWEGGIRVPFLMQWKGKIKPGTVVDHPVIALDIHPTAVAAAGGSVPANLDGVDLMPHLTGAKRSAPHDTLYWRFGAQSAIRRGEFKLVRTGSGEAELYNLRDDLGETRNLAGANPSKLKELDQAWAAWSSQMSEPKWSRAAEGKKGGKKKKKKA